MAGPLILSNRLRAMQEAAMGFGDTIAGLRDSKRLNARQDAQDKMTAESHAASMKQAGNQDLLQGFALKRAGQEEQDASSLRNDQNELSALDSGLQSFGPRMPADETPTPYTNADRNVRARLMASIETKITGKPVSRDEILTRKDQEIQDKAAMAAGASRKKEVEDRNYSLDERRVKVQEREAAAKESQAKTTKAQNKETKLTEAQSKTIGAAGMAKTMLDDLANQFKDSKLGGMKGFAADVLESVPLVGGKMAPETNAYNDKRRITAETFLREATGAAAPPAEIKFYTNLLPEPGDSEDQAQSSLNAFRGAVMAKVHGVASTLRAQGKDEQADQIEAKMQGLFDTSVNIKGPKSNRIGRFTVEED